MIAGAPAEAAAPPAESLELLQQVRCSRNAAHLRAATSSTSCLQSSHACSVSRRGPASTLRRTVALFKGAHPLGEEVSCLRFNRAGTLLLTRCMDGTMKLFDVRNTKAPLREVTGLETNSAHTQAVFSPDEGLVLTAVNASREGASGAVAFYETSTFKLVRRLGVSSGSAVGLLWHAKLNQIFVGAGGAKVRPERAGCTSLLSASGGTCLSHSEK